MPFALSTWQLAAEIADNDSGTNPFQGQHSVCVTRERNSKPKLGACQRNAIKRAPNYAQTHAFAYKMAAIFSTLLVNCENLGWL